MTGRGWWPVVRHGVESCRRGTGWVGNPVYMVMQWGLLWER